MSIKRHIFNSITGPVEFSKYGTGTPVLFLHGDHSNAKETLAHKGISPDDFTLITPSRPGYGSTIITNLNKTPSGFSEQIHELIKELGYERILVVGVSAGGLTAIAFAAQYPELVSKLVLASSISKRWLYSDDPTYIRGSRLFYPGIEKFSWAMIRLFMTLTPQLAAKQLLRDLTDTTNLKLSQTDLQEIKQMIARQSSGQGFMIDLDQDLSRDVLQKVQCPTLIVHSKNDKIVLPEHAFHAKDHIPNSKIYWVENSTGHLIWIGEEAETTTNYIAQFLSSDH